MEIRFLVQNVVCVLAKSPVKVGYSQAAGGAADQHVLAGVPPVGLLFLMGLLKCPAVVDSSVSSSVPSGYLVGVTL